MRQGTGDREQTKGPAMPGLFALVMIPTLNYSRSRKIDAMTLGFIRPSITATIQIGFLSGAYAMR